MFLYERTPAFVLGQKEKGEADKIIFCYTEEYGRLDLVARSVRTMTSKLKGSVEPFTLGELEFIRGKSKTLTDFIPVKRWTDLSSWGYLDKASALFLRFLKEEEKDDRVWKLLNFFLHNLNEKGYYFLAWNLIDCLGYFPELNNCPVCRKKLKEEKLLFSPAEGGVVCCGLGEKINPDVIKTLRLIKTDKFFQLKSLPAQMEEILDQYLNYLLE
jgi:DNA repair protein RecO (recombination protein O)